MYKQEFKVRGMTCEACAKLIKVKLMKVPSIINVAVNLREKQLMIESDEDINFDTLSISLTGTGYQLFRRYR